MSQKIFVVFSAKQSRTFPVEVEELSLMVDDEGNRAFFGELAVAFFGVVEDLFGAVALEGMGQKLA